MADLTDLAIRFYKEVIDNGNIDALDEFVADEFVEHEKLPPGIPPGKEGVRAWVTMMRAAFPDLTASIDDVLTEGDRVVVRVTMSGTHRGELMGIPATGKRISFPAIDIVRIRRDKAVEHWGVTDTGAVLEQLGVIPPMA